MEKQDLSKILISDSEYYGPNASYAHFLKRHNIVTVEELLNGTFKGTTFNGFKMQGVTVSGLAVFIKLLKHKYLGTPLSSDVYLDEKIDLENTVLHSEHGYVRFLTTNGEKEETNIRSFICGDRGYYHFHQFIRKKNFQKSHREHSNLPVEDVKLIDFFKWIVEEDITGLVPFAKTYIEVYEKNKNYTNENAETIKALKDQLTGLIEQKVSLDAQITDIQKKIDELSKDDSKGGMGL